MCALQGIAFTCFMESESETSNIVHQDSQLDVFISKSGFWGALTILSVYMRIAVKRFAQGQSCGCTRKQLDFFVTINFIR